MKVTFVYPDLIGSANYGGISYLGIASLSSVLKKEGYNVSLLHVTQPLKKNKLIKILEDEKTDLVAFSSTTQMFGFVQQWSAWIKEETNKIPLIVGGIHPTLYPHQTLKDSCVDLCCIGEGEGAIVEVCQALQEKTDVSEISNLCGVWEGKTFFNPPRPLIANLDDLPFPDRKIFNYQKLVDGRENTAFFMASRGCPYDCSYCCNRALKLASKNCNNWVRFRSVDNVIQEVQLETKNNPRIKRIVFYDDILALRKSWFSEFTKMYAKNIGMPFRCNMRADILAKKGMASLLKSAGCWNVVIGLESGSDTVRSKILKKNISDEQIIKAGKECKIAGMGLSTYNMLGIPGEDFSDILKTVKLNAKINANFMYASIYYPFSNTDLYEVCRKKKMLTGRTAIDYVEETVLNFNKKERARIIFVRNHFRFLVNSYRLISKLSAKKEKYVHNIFEKVLYSHLTSWMVFIPANWIFKKVRHSRLLSVIVTSIKAAAQRRRQRVLARKIISNGMNMRNS